METSPEARLLIVEDDIIIRTLLSKRLRAAGYQVELAQNGREGLEAARRFRPDLILTDWMMPVMDGASLIAALRAEPALRRTFVILLTSKDERRDRITGRDLGADDYVIKPWSEEELLARVRAGLRIQALQQKLARVEHKAALLAVAATLGYEINDPLTVLSRALQLARQRPAAMRTDEELLDRCQTQVDRISEVVLALNQLSEPELAPSPGATSLLELEGGGPRPAGAGEA
jgi:DNA-binding response OmpR family regulator